jgi:hypothetical protein
MEPQTASDTSQFKLTGLVSPGTRDARVDRRVVR